ncbi:11190_t:CDS:2, partial [Racocetra fulgida]
KYLNENLEYEKQKEKEMVYYRAIVMLAEKLVTISKKEKLATTSQKEKPSNFEKKLYKEITKHNKKEVKLEDILKNIKEDENNLIKFANNFEDKIKNKDTADGISDEIKNSDIYKKYKTYKTENDDEAMQLVKKILYKDCDFNLFQKLVFRTKSELWFKIEDIKLTQRHNHEIRRLLCGLEHDLTDIIIEGDERNQELKHQRTTNTGSQGTTNTGSQGTNTGSQGTTNTGSQGTNTGSQGTNTGSQGTNSGSQGTNSGSQGTNSGSQGINTGSQEQTSE